MADGRTLAVSYVWPTGPYGAQLSMAVRALDTTSGGGSLQAHSHVLWSQPGQCVFCVQEALISPDGKSLTAAAVQHTAHGYRNALLRIALPSGRYRVLYESPVERNPISTFTQDGSGQHAIVVSGSQASWSSCKHPTARCSSPSASPPSPGDSTAGSGRRQMTARVTSPQDRAAKLAGLSHGYGGRA